MDELELELEQAALKEIVQHWRYYNQTLFGRSMKVPQFQTHEGMSRLGYWSNHQRMISISKDLIFSEPWYKVLAVLQHEMAHQFVDEVMQSPNVPPHGELFQSVLKKFGIEQEHESGIKDMNNENTPVLSKVRKLLSLAQSSNQHEAENAMKLANELMLKWNIQHQSDTDEMQYCYRQLGKPGRVSLFFKMLSQILSDYFFVDSIWVSSYDVRKKKSGRVLEICGKQENLEIASYVYDYLKNCVEQLWKQYKKENPDANKNNYQYGLMLGFLQKLQNQQQAHEEQNALVWLGDPLLDEYFSNRHPRVRKMSSSNIRVHQKSLKDGKAHGQNIVIHKGINDKKEQTHYLN